jgi:AAA domain-containing protein
MIVLKSLGYTIDGIVALFERYPDGIAAKYRGRLRHQVETVWAKLKIPDPKPTDITVIKVLSKAEFLAGFVPPDYLVEGVIQRRFIYALTARTGDGKTALALLLAQAVGSADPNARFGPHAVEKGKVVYFVGENPDDVRCRTKGADALRSDNPESDRIYFIEGVFDIAGLREKLNEAVAKLGGVDLVIIDTSAAYFLGDDEISNTQMGTHARTLRALTTLPGGPCVVVLCHPTKHVTDPSQLLPRGGSAFLNEMDGNLTAWRHDETLVTFHHGKLRGPGFEPITFKLEKITRESLVDSKGRQMPTVRAASITEQEEEQQERDSEEEERGSCCPEWQAVTRSCRHRSRLQLAPAGQETVSEQG